MIAAKVGYRVSTVYRERKRNGFEDDACPAGRGYYAVVALGMAFDRRKRLGKLHWHPELASFVIERLRAAWSLEETAGFLRYRSSAEVRLLHETVYRWNYGPEGRRLELAQYLPSGRRWRRTRHVRIPRGLFVPTANMIENRPQASKTERNTATGKATSGCSARRSAKPT